MKVIWLSSFPVRRKASLIFLVATACLLSSLSVSAFAPHATRRDSRLTPQALRPVVVSSEVSKLKVSPLHRSLSVLQASPLSAIASSSPLFPLLILTGIVFVHEAGHYLAARLFGIKVEEFSIGVGPKLFGFQAFGGDEFNLRALPIGGYVRFPENYNTTLVREMERQAMKAADEFDRNQGDSVGYSILDAFTLGYLKDRRRKQARAKRDQRQQQKQQRSSRPSWLPGFGGANKKTVEDSKIPKILDIDDVQIDYFDDPDLLQNRPWQERAVVLSGGVIFNLLFAFMLYFGQIAVGPGIPQPVFDSGALITTQPRLNAPSSGLLNKGDVILRINGMPVTLSQSPSAREATSGIDSVISTIRATPDGQAVQLSVLRATSHQSEEVVVRPQHASGANSPQSIGVMLAPNFVKAESIQAKSPIEASVLAAKEVGSLTRETASGLVSLFAGLFSPKESSSASQVSGPIGLIRVGAEVVATKDWTEVLLFAAAISINLGVVNAFPLPALDGGQLLFVLSEAVTRRKIDQRLQEGINGAAVLVLLLVSAGAAINDIESIFSL